MGRLFYSHVVLVDQCSKSEHNIIIIIVIFFDYIHSNDVGIGPTDFVFYILSPNTQSSS